MEALASKFDVIAVTLRHFDEGDIGGFGLNTHADDLIELLNELDERKPVHIVGWSYSADVVLNALVKQDFSVEKVFLYEPGYPGCLLESELNLWQSDANSMFGPVFAEFHRGDLPSAVVSLIDGSGNRKGYFQSQSEVVRELQLAKSYTLAYQLNQKEQPLIDINGLSSSKVPVVFGYGENTRDLFKLVTIRSSELLNNAKLIKISSENHMLPQDDPIQFSNYIENLFLSQG
ncbi:alpha/beta fold hydrolase [Photobacterium kishitanii]|uniref:alpha/beta fold hydrolase n=1 Tax=Photobacterium kishitanii TaxID=318456 RepID=UPI0021599013|nr:alpha/beta hydrolase [Photobacterium kishitanii]